MASGASSVSAFRTRRKRVKLWRHARNHRPTHVQKTWRSRRRDREGRRQALVGGADDGGKGHGCLFGAVHRTRRNVSDAGQARGALAGRTRSRELGCAQQRPMESVGADVADDARADVSVSRQVLRDPNSGPRRIGDISAGMSTSSARINAHPKGSRRSTSRSTCSCGPPT